MIKKEGYKDFRKTLLINEDKEQLLKVKYVWQPFSPLFNATKWCLLSMFIPGAKILFSPEPPRISLSSWSIDDAVFCSALAFYFTSALYLADRFLFEKEDFLTEKCRESYKKSRNKVLNIELKVTAVCYGINVITSFIAGLTYPTKTKDVIEITWGNQSNRTKIGLAYSLKLK